MPTPRGFPWKGNGDDSKGPNMTPEERARQKIDAMLTASGWAVQEKRNANLAAARDVAVAELSFKTGEPDYTLFVDAKALGAVVPPRTEQTRIVAEVERRLSVVGELEAVVSANLQRANRIHQSILQKAFIGKLNS
jgi:type I site-specific restriction endonuclease